MTQANRKTRQPTAATITPIRVKSTSPLPLYDQVRQAIRDQITSGKLLPGQRLPSMRQLCNELNIAYATVARAVRQLVEEGVLEAKAGRGTRVAIRRSARLQTIGLLGQSSYKELMRDSRYYNRLIHLIQEELLDHGQVVAYGRWPEGTPINTLFHGLQQIDGLLVCKLSDEQLKQIPIAQRMGVPIIELGRTNTQANLPGVDSDNFHDNFRLTQALIQQGHRVIVYLSMPNEHTRRRQGYEAAMKDAGLDRFVVQAPVETWAGLVLKANSLPSAAVISGAPHFPTLYESLKGSRLQPGKELAIGVYDDNLWRLVEPLKIPYLRIDQQIDAIACTAVAQMMNMLKDEQYHPTDQLIPSKLVSVDSQGVCTEL
jgi:DNA-binding LacI/PurR family transcriptional regulator